MLEKIKRIINSFDIKVLGLISIIILYQIFRCQNLPGLYFDSVNPDFLAIEMLFPGENPVTPKFAQTGFPFLAQLYHGTFTVWLELFIVGIIGRTSLLTVRICNSIYVLLICLAIYLLLKKVIFNRYILSLSMVVLVFSPQIFCFMRTQYHLKLPGTMLTFFSLYLLISMDKDDSSEKRTLLSGLAQGLAFYSYFVFLFFVPALCLINIYFTKKGKKCIWKNMFVWFCGFGTACTMYVAGYLDLIVTKSSLSQTNKKSIIFSAEFFLLLGCILLIYVLLKKHQSDKIYKRIVFVLLFFAAIMIGMFILNYNRIIEILSPLFKATNFNEKSLNFFERVNWFRSSALSILKNLSCEWLMMGKGVSKGGILYIILPLILPVVTLITVLYNRQKEDVKRQVELLFISYELVISYCFCAFFFAHRMGIHHLTPIWFLIFLINIQEINILFILSLKKVNTILIKTLIMCLLLLNFVNCNLVCTNLEITKGERLYTNKINEIADEALKNKKDGIREVYVFPESGLGSNFIYLTMNQVKCRSLNSQVLKDLVDDGYLIKVYFWTYENEEIYAAKMRECGIDNIEEISYLSGTGVKTLYGLEQAN